MGLLNFVSLILGEECRLRVSKNRVLKRYLNLNRRMWKEGKNE
jgi:hypothetical protein